MDPSQDALAVSDSLDTPSSTMGLDDSIHKPTITAITQPPGDDEDTTLAERALIRRFERQIQKPDFIAKDLERMDADRKYVHTDVMMPMVKDSVTTNLALRNQQIRLSQTYAKDPDLAVQPKKLIAPVPSIDAIIAAAGNPQAIQLAAQADQQFQQQMQQFRSLMAKLGLFGQTVEILVKHFADEMEMRKAFVGIIQDATTVGIAWLKVSWHENRGQDPLGVSRSRDFDDLAKRLTRLAEQFERGDFTKDDAEYQQMTDLAQNVRDQVMAENWLQSAYGSAQIMNPETGQMEDVDPREMRWSDPSTPTCDEIGEIPHYRGFIVDQILPEDLRWDWRITRPEDFRRCRHMTHGVKMTWDEIEEDFGVTRDEVMQHRIDRTADAMVDKRVNGPANAGAVTEDPADRSKEYSSLSNHEVFVWERWDREQNRVYVWAEGSDRFLREYEPEVVSKFWFPFFPLYFNRVTGKFLPISDTQLTRSLIDEFNLLRTHDREGRRAAYNKYIVAKDLFTDEELQYLKTCPPEGVVTCERADDVHKYFSRVIGSNYNPMLYDTGKVRADIDAMSGISSAARGTTGQAKFATEEQNANNQMQVESDRFREACEALMGEIFTHMAEILIQIFPEANARAIAGPGAYWPYTDRETLWRNLQLEIEAGSTGKPDQMRKLNQLQTVAQTLQLLGLTTPVSGFKLKGLSYMRDILDAMDVRREPEDYLEEIGMGMADPGITDAARVATMQPAQSEMAAASPPLPPGVMGSGPPGGPPPGAPPGPPPPPGAGPAGPPAHHHPPTAGQPHPSGVPQRVGPPPMAGAPH